MALHNHIRNGDFSSGDFTHWIAKAYDTPMSVELWQSSHAARLVGGRSAGQNLASETFAVSPGRFIFSFDVQAPDAVPLENSAHRRFHIKGGEKLDNPLLYAFLTYTVWATHSNGGAAEVWSELAYVDPQKKRINLEGVIPPDFAQVDVHFGIPNDPFGNKGPYYLDNVQFLMST